MLFHTLHGSGGRILYYLLNLNQHDNSPVGFSQDISGDMILQGKSCLWDQLQRQFFQDPHSAFWQKISGHIPFVNLPARKPQFCIVFQNHYLGD